MLTALGIGPAVFVGSFRGGLITMRAIHPAATVEAMAARHPGLQVIAVPDRGHVPALEGDLVAKVADFVAACDKTRAAL